MNALVTIRMLTLSNVPPVPVALPLLPHAGEILCRSYHTVVPRPCASRFSPHPQEAQRRNSDGTAGLDEVAENTPTEPDPRARRASNGLQLRPPEGGEGGGFPAREARMRAASAARWAEDELFNLRNAFDLQLKRLEVERSSDEKPAAQSLCLTHCFNVESEPFYQLFPAVRGSQPLKCLKHRMKVCRNNAWSRALDTCPSSSEPRYLRPKFDESAEV